ncbi:MAG: PhoX family phosphatase [Variovorax sp.]|nr:MAG: PhoX family phosphatase [Variovorax sp.]
MPMHRRHLLQTGAAAVVALLGHGAAAARAEGGRSLGFTSVPTTLRDALTVPPEYEAQVLYPWGAPTGIASSMPAFVPDGSNSADDQALQAGMHHDGMHFFALDARGQRGLLVMNHEYTDERLLHAEGTTPWSAEKTRKSLHAMGVSVIEVELTPAGWRQVLPSRYARRIHGATPMQIAGPAAGAPMMRTAADPSGRRVLGTFANCAMGVTPWGTYLTCEENFQGYFGGPREAAAQATAAQRRYGTLGGSQWIDYWRVDERFDLSKQPNEAHRFGWVVEIDPFDPTSTPVKRTALGRKRQEGATCTLTRDGRLAVYMGDDAPFEYVYKFVSRDKVRPGNDAAVRVANRHLLDEGTLYAARYNGDGRGQWLALEHGRNGIEAASGFADQAEVLVHARLAGDVVRATKMDRPEWIAVHPHSGEVYLAVTGDSQRGQPSQPAVDAANPRERNFFGGILRWREDAGDAGSLGFAWDHFVLAGDPAADGAGARYPSADADAFGSPDGLHFDSSGLLWIQTDMGGKGTLGNNQMLCADPASGRIKRFLVGPAGCEVTGCVVTPDRRSLFVNIQHPSGTWPDVGRPRSATVVVRRRDGAIVGT